MPGRNSLCLCATGLAGRIPVSLRPAGGGPQADNPAEDITYLRFAYSGTVGEPEPGRALDTGIVRTLWLTADELRAAEARHRSPLILRCLDDLLAGVTHPLDTVWADPSLQQPRRLG